MKDKNDFGSLLWEQAPELGLSAWFIILVLSLAIGALTTTPPEPAAKPHPEHVGSHP